MIRDVAIGGLQVAILLFAVFGFVDAVGWHLLRRSCRRDDVPPRLLFRQAMRADRRKRGAP